MEMTHVDWGEAAMDETEASRGRTRKHRSHDGDADTAAARWSSMTEGDPDRSRRRQGEYGSPTVGNAPTDCPVDVSVIVPTYNMERYLRAAVESALASGTEARIEVICVNDGSKDSSLSIMRDLAARDDRVIVIDKPNGGYGQSVNVGLDAAKGTYVAILEPDDWVEPGMYDEMFLLAEQTRERMAYLPDIVKSSYWRIIDSGTDNEHRLRCSYYMRMPDRLAPFQLADEPHLVMHHPSIWSALYRRQFLEDADIRMREVPGAGWVDNPWLYETLCQADSIIYTNEAWYCYREDLAGSSSTGDVMLLSVERWNDMMDVLDRLGIDDDGIRSALHVTGFRYLQDILRHDGLANPVVASAVDGMLRRMDLRLVEELGNVSPSLLAMPFEAQGQPVPNLPARRYHSALAREFVRTVRVDGPKQALERMVMKLRG